MSSSGPGRHAAATIEGLVRRASRQAPRPPRDLYLDLLEDALVGVLHRDGGQTPQGPVEYDAGRRWHGVDWPDTAHTMIGSLRMRNLRQLVELVLAEGVPGDLLEAGVWRGGASIYMRGILEAHGVRDRTVYVADSFEGLPPPEREEDAGDTHHEQEELAVSLEEVEANFAAYGLLDTQVCFLRGWFRDTLPGPVERLAVLRLDGDMFGSTWDALCALYPRVSPGGFVIVDDYHGLEPCRLAVDRFRVDLAECGVPGGPLQRIDQFGAFWRVPQG